MKYFKKEKSEVEDYIRILKVFELNYFDDIEGIFLVVYEVNKA